MQTEVFVGYRLDGMQWLPCTGGATTMESALDLVQHHFMNSNADARRFPSVERRVYNSNAEPWFATMVEFGPEDRKMMMLGTYKIIKGNIESN